MSRVSRFVAVSTCAGSLLLMASPAAAQFTTRVVASGFTAPVDVVQDPSDTTVQYVVEQGGRIRVVRTGALQATDFLNLAGSIATGGERGLLGLAFPRDYATSGRFYVNFTNPQGHTVIARFRRSANPLVADPGSRFDLRWSGVGYIEQPFSNHNGGHLAFGPDGYLYIGMGDGGSGNDPNHYAQNPNSRLGKFLRIDVSVPDADPVGYRIPPGNPFASSAVPDVWSFGLRNPWKFSFDDPALGGTGAMLIADVGQNAWEEVSVEPAGRSGRNYGCRNREGAHPNIGTPPPAFLPLVDPIYEYDHSAGSSITGGYVYRGRRLPANIRGRYFFADFITGRVWSIALSYTSSGEAVASDPVEHTAQLGANGGLGNISSFGVDAAGELYIVSDSRGAILAVGFLPLPPTNLRVVR